MKQPTTKTALALKSLKGNKFYTKGERQMGIQVINSFKNELKDIVYGSIQNDASIRVQVKRLIQEIEEVENGNNTKN